MEEFLALVALQEVDAFFSVVNYRDINIKIKKNRWGVTIVYELDLGFRV